MYKIKYIVKWVKILFQGRVPVVCVSQTTKLLNKKTMTNIFLEVLFTMKKYDELKVELVYLNQEDVVRCSNPDETQPDPFGSNNWA